MSSDSEFPKKIVILGMDALDHNLIEKILMN